MYNHIAVKFSSVEETEKMMKFLSDNIELIEMLETTDISQPTFSFKFNTGVDITQKQFLKDADKMIVFERYYVGLVGLKLFTWMAVKSSCRNENGNPFLLENYKVTEIFPYETTDEGLNYYVVDNDGLFYTKLSGKEKLFLLAKGEYFNLIEQNKLMKELNQIYLKENV